MRSKGQAAISMEQLVRSYALGSSTEAAEYSEKSRRVCRKYQGPAASGAFATWEKQEFLPKVWRPQVEAARHQAHLERIKLTLQKTSQRETPSSGSGYRSLDERLRERERMANDTAMMEQLAAMQAQVDQLQRALAGRQTQPEQQDSATVQPDGEGQSAAGSRARDEEEGLPTMPQPTPPPANGSNGGSQRLTELSQRSAPRLVPRGGNMEPDGQHLDDALSLQREQRLRDDAARLQSVVIHPASVADPDAESLAPSDYTLPVDGAEITLGLPESIRALIEAVVRQMMPTHDDHFHALVSCVSDDYEPKLAILMAIESKGLTGEVRLSYFRRQMMRHSPTAVLREARWNTLKRWGLQQPVEAFAGDFKTIAEDCGRTVREINRRFAELALQPWQAEPMLKEQLDSFMLKYAEEIYDADSLQVDRLAHKIMTKETAYTLMVADRVAKMPQVASGSSGNASGSSRTDIAVKLGLPKDKTGKYYACAACFVNDSEHKFHAPYKCPYRKNKSSKEAAGGSAMTADGEEHRSSGGRAGGRGGGRHSSGGGRGTWKCHNCGKPGHSYRNCPKELTPELKKKKEQAMQWARTLMAEAAAEAAASKASSVAGDRDDGRAAFASSDTPSAWEAPQQFEDIPGGFTFEDESDDAAGFAADGTAARRVTRQSVAAIQPAAKESARPSPAGARARQQLRMRDPQQDELREQANRLPQGFVGRRQLPDPASLAPAAQPEMGHEEEAGVRARHAQLVSLLKTSLGTARLTPLPAELVADHSPEAVSRWRSAQSLALRGQLGEGHDPREVAWRRAVQDAIDAWRTQARLQYSDYLQVDLRAVVREAAVAVYGQQMMGQPGSEEILLAAVSDAVLSRYLEDSVGGGATDAAQLRAWQRSVAMTNGRRRSVAHVDTAKVTVTVGGQTLKAVVADTGANKALLHARVLQRMEKDVPLAGTIAITNVSGGRTEMPCTARALPVSLAVGPGTAITASTRFVICDGEDLPDLLIDNELMALLGDLSIHPAQWVGTYSSQPWRPAAPRHEVPLRPMTGQRLARAQAAQSAGEVLPRSWVHDNPFAVLETAEECEDEDTSMEASLVFVCYHDKPETVPRRPGKEPMQPLQPLQPNTSPVVGGGETSRAAMVPTSVITIQKPKTDLVKGQDAPPYPFFNPDMPYHEVFNPLFMAMADGGSVVEEMGGHPELALYTKSPGYTQEELDSVPSLPHVYGRLYHLNLAAMQGQHQGGYCGVYLCAGVLTSLVVDVTEGMHMGQVRVLERDTRRRWLGQQVIDKLHEYYPLRLPESATRRAFVWAEPISHDGYWLTGQLVFEELGHDKEVVVHLEAGCPGHSAMGPKNGFDHAESGALVPMTVALVDLQYLLSRARGFKDWSEAPAQFGYIMENVPGPLRHSEHSPRTLMAAAFMDRVYGPHMYHNGAVCGDLSSRGAKWWSNMFTPQFYEVCEPLFRRPPSITLGEMVRECTRGAFKPQVARTSMGGLNVVGEEMRLLPKLLSSPTTKTMRMGRDGQPGQGMLEAVAPGPGQPRFVPSPSIVRARSLNIWEPHFRVLQDAVSDRECSSIVGDMCAPTSARVMLRMAVGYSAAVQHPTTNIPVDREGGRQWADPHSEVMEEELQAIQRAVVTAAAREEPFVTAVEHEYATVRAQTRPQQPPKETVDVPMPGSVALTLKRQRQQERKSRAKVRAAKAREAADARRRAAKAMEEAKAAHRVNRERARTTPKQSRGRAGVPKLVMLLVLACAAFWGPGAYEAGLRAGHTAMLSMGGRLPADMVPPPHVWQAEMVDEAVGRCQGDPTSGFFAGPDFNGSDPHSRRSSLEVAFEPGGQLYAAMANRKATGQPEPTAKVPSRLKNSKDGSQHEWAIGESFAAKKAFAAMMDSNPDWYAWGLKDLRPVKGAEYSIKLTDTRPVFARQYHLAHRETEFAAAWVKELEDAGLVKPIRSPYAAPVVVAPKKDEGGQWNDLRYAIDYRRLNAVTERDQYPTPTPDEIMARLNGAEIMTSMDAQKAFHQVRVADDTQPLLAFHSGGRLMTWERMPFGGKNSVACWQRVVDEALSGLEFAQAYADDILVWSDGDEAEHIRRVQIVMQRLHEHGIQISPKKCKLGMRRIEFLGHIVSGEGTEPMWDKVEAIVKLPRPTTVSEVRSFIGMATYYCKFLDHYSHVKKPLTALTKKDVVFQWGVEQEDAFQEIKRMLISAPVLQEPDWNRPFNLHTDWSKAGVGATLSQIGADGKEYAIAYASRMNSKAEGAFSSYEGEVSAVVYAVQRFRYWLWGRPFRLYTDCKAMQWLTSTAKLRSKIARWSLILAEYDMEIVHRAGKDNTVPDLLSRQPYGGTPAPEPGSAQLASAYLAAVPQLPVAGFSRLAGQWAMPLLLGWSQGFSAEAKRPRFDIWEDASAVQFVRQQLSHTAVTPSRWQQLTRLCAQYEARGDEIWRTVPGQMPRLVPQPSERSRIVHKVHESIGHLGRDRTYAMVAQRYYWPKMWSTVAAALQECTICDRVHASFSAKPDRLQSLPLMGLFYRFTWIQQSLCRQRKVAAAMS